MNKLHVVAAASAIALLASAGAANAKIYTFHASGAGGDGNESASATITTAPGTITVVLNDLESNITSAGQAVSDLEIDLGTGPGGSVTLGSQMGSQIDIAKKTGAVTPVAGDPTGWGAALTSSNTITLASAGPGSPGGQPFDLIIGPGPYPGPGDGSLGSHSPFILDTGTFVINLPAGFTANITGVTFSFGTSPDNFIPGLPGSVPEPATWAMMLLGVFGVGGLLRRRREALAAA